MIIILDENSLNAHGKNVKFEDWEFKHFTLDNKMIMLANAIIFTKDRAMRIMKQRWDTESFKADRGYQHTIRPIEHLPKLISEINIKFIGKGSFKPGTRKIRS